MNAEAYELQRQANIAENIALLQSLGLTGAAKAGGKRPAAASSSKQKVAPSAKRPKSSASERPPAEATRRSGRATKPVVYYTELSPEIKGAKPRGTKSRPSQAPFIEPDSEDVTEDDEADYRERRPLNIGPTSMLLRRAQRLGVREHTPKQFGHIPYVPVGTWWATRMVRGGRRSITGAGDSSDHSTCIVGLLD